MKNFDELTLDVIEDGGVELNLGNVQKTIELCNKYWFVRLFWRIHDIPENVVLKYAERFKSGEFDLGCECLVKVPFYIAICEKLSRLYIVRKGEKYFVQVGKEINVD